MFGNNKNNKVFQELIKICSLNIHSDCYISISIKENIIFKDFLEKKKTTLKISNQQEINVR